ncbi:MAG: hypothetical protein QM788_05375 [Roseateles sp.]|uniref:hypothetical protein n=1 Tax=Roseateles sp. TaxID=1971397 RepID=UPI0039EB0AEB
MSRSTKQLAAGQRRTLRTLRERLLCMADEWEDVDEFIRGELTDLADQTEELMVALAPDPNQEGL